MANPSSQAWLGLKTPVSIALTLVLCAQALGYYLLPKTEAPLDVRPLSSLARQMGEWHMVQEIPMEESVQEVLKSSDSVNRYYAAPGRAAPANLFIAFFKSQRSGVAPHSPKNCLPGSGWAAMSSSTETLEIPGHGVVPVNRYVVARGEERTIVYYWYQSAHRAVASEYWAKIWLVLDSIRYRRSDTSLVRVVVPTGPGKSAEDTDVVAREFLRTAYPYVRAQLPH